MPGDRDVVLRLKLEDDAMQKFAASARAAAEALRGSTASVKALETAAKQAANAQVIAGSATQQVAAATNQVAVAAKQVPLAYDNWTNSVTQMSGRSVTEIRKIGVELDRVNAKAKGGIGGGGGAGGGGSAAYLTAGLALAGQQFNNNGYSAFGKVAGAAGAGAAFGMSIGGPPGAAIGALAAAALQAATSLGELNKEFEKGVGFNIRDVASQRGGAIRRQQEERDANLAAMLANEKLQKANSASDAAIKKARDRELFQVGIQSNLAQASANLPAGMSDKNRRLAMLQYEEQRRNSGEFVQQGGSSEDAIANMQRLIALRQEIAAMGKEELRDQMQVADVAVKAAQRQYDLAVQLAAKEKERLQTAQEKFGQLSSFEQAQFRALDKKLASGQELTRDELGKARKLGVNSEAVAAIDRKRGAGFLDTFTGQQIAGRQAAAEAKAAEATVQINAQNNVKVELSGSLETNAEQLTASILPLLKQLEALTNTRIKAEAEKQTEAARAANVTAQQRALSQRIAAQGE